MISFYVIRIIEKMSSKLSVWAWHKLWRNRKDGIGYKYHDRKKKK